MARLTRVYQKVFANQAANNGVFGSLQAGNPTMSNNIATLQSLPAFETGWDDAIESGDKLPPLEEFQGIQYGISYQQAYMLQEGIAEWEASTPYYKGSLAKEISGSSFKLYCSLTDNNVGNAVSDVDNWKLVMDSDNVYALDSTVVHLSGTETISGNKTFSGSNTFSGSVALNGTISGGNSVKETIDNWGMPNYSSATSFNSGTDYEAPSNGFAAFIGSNSDHHTTVVKINGNTILQYGNDAGYDGHSGIIPVKKGDIINISTSGSGSTVTNTFYPCIGG